MKIIIEANPKEIADLVSQLQNQLIQNVKNKVTEGCGKPVTRPIGTELPVTPDGLTRDELINRTN